MQMIFVENPLVVTAAIKPQHHQQADRVRGTDTVPKEPYAVHRRKPVVLQALDPMDSRDGERKRGARQNESSSFAIDERRPAITSQDMRSRRPAETKRQSVA